MGRKESIEVKVFLSGEDIIGSTVRIDGDLESVVSAIEDVRGWIALFAPEGFQLLAEWGPEWGARPIEKTADLGDRDLYHFAQIDEANDTGVIEFRVRQKGQVLPSPADFGSAASPAPVSPASARPAAQVSFSGSNDFNTPKFNLDGGDYATVQSASGGEFGCFQSITLTGPTTVRIGSLLTESADVETSPNNLYGIEPGGSWTSVSDRGVRHSSGTAHTSRVHQPIRAGHRRS